jgi:hypothetical protein
LFIVKKESVIAKNKAPTPENEGKGWSAISTMVEIHGLGVKSGAEGQTMQALSILRSIFKNPC